MTYAFLPIQSSTSPSARRQIFTLDLSPDGIPLHARAEIRYLPAPDIWTLSIWDNATGEMLVSQIPLICSYTRINDLLAPFRHLRSGHGLGSLFVLRAVDNPSTPDPSAENLTEFQILWGDTFDLTELQ